MKRSVITGIGAILFLLAVNQAQSQTADGRDDSSLGGDGDSYDAYKDRQTIADRPEETCLINQNGQLDESLLEKLRSRPAMLMRSVFRAWQCGGLTSEKCGNPELITGKQFCILVNLHQCVNQFTPEQLFQLAIQTECPKQLNPRMGSMLGRKLRQYLVTVAETDKPAARQALIALRHYLDSLAGFNLHFLQSVLEIEESQLKQLVRTELGPMVKRAIGMALRKIFTMRARTPTEMKNMDDDSKVNLPAETIRGLKSQDSETRTNVTRGILRGLNKQRHEENERMEATRDRAAVEREKMKQARRPTAAAIATADVLREGLANLNEEDGAALLGAPEVVNSLGRNELKTIPRSALCQGVDSDGVDPNADDSLPKRFLRELCETELGSNMPPSLRAQDTPSEIRDMTGTMSSDQEKVDYVTKMNKNEEDLSRGQEDAIDEVALPILTANSNAGVTTANCRSMRSACKKLDVTTVIQTRFASPENRTEYCRDMGKAKMENVAGDQVEAITNFCLFESTASLGELGDVLSRVNEDTVDNQLPVSTLSDNIAVLARKVCRLTVRQKLWQRFRDYKGGLANLTAADFKAIGCLITHATDSELQELDSNAEFGRAAKETMDSCDDLKERIKTGICGTFLNSIRDSAKSRVMARQKAAAVVAEEQDNPSTRKKRGAGGPGGQITCDGLATFGPAERDIVELETLNAAIFTECPERLNVANYTLTQVQTLIARAKEVMGSDVGNWTLDFKVALGVVLLGLNDYNELSSLDFTSDALVSAIGQQPVSGDFNQKYMMMLEQYKSQRQIYEMMMMTGSQLTTLGRILSGATSEELSEIRSQEYDIAATVLGGIRSFSAQQLASLAAKAKEVYGSNPGNWSASTLGSVGSVFAGLSGPDMASIPAENIPYVTEDAMAKIPGSSLASLTEDQIAQLSAAQANALTDAAIQELSSAKQAIINNTRAGSSAGSTATTAANPAPSQSTTQPVPSQTTTTPASGHSSSSASSSQSTTPAASGQSTTPAPSGQSTTPAPSGQSTTPAPSGQSTTPSAVNSGSSSSTASTTTKNPVGGGESSVTTTTAKDSGLASSTTARTDNSDTKTTTKPGSGGNSNNGSTTERVTTTEAAPTLGTRIDVEAVRGVSEKMDPNELRKLSGDSMTTAILDEMNKRSRDLTPGQRRAVERAVAERMAGDAAFDADYTRRAGSLAPPRKVNGLTKEQVTQILESSANQPVCSDDSDTQRCAVMYGRKTAQVVMTNRALLKQASATAAAWSPREVENVVAAHTVDSDFINDLKDADMSSENWRVVKKKYITDTKVDLASLDGPGWTNLLDNVPPGFVQALNADDIKSAPVETSYKLLSKMSGVVGSELGLAKPDYSPTGIMDKTSVKVQAMEKARATLTTATEADVRTLCSSGMLTTKDVQALGEKVCDCTKNDISNGRLAYKPGVGCMIYEKCKVKWGNFVNAQIPTKFGSLASCASKADIEALIPDGPSVKALCDGYFASNSGVKKHWAKQLKKRLDGNEADFGDPVKMAAYGCLLPLIDNSTKYLDKIPEQNQNELCEKYACEDISQRTEEEVRAMMKKCFKIGLNPRSLMCAGRTGQMTMASLLKAGDIGVGGLLTCPQVAASLDVLQTRLLDCDARKAILTCAMADNTLKELNDATTLASYGTLCELLTDSDWAKVTDSSKMCEQLAAVAEAYEAQGSNRRMRAYFGFASSGCAGTGRGGCLARMLEASKSAVCQGTVTTRRRRASNPITCTEIKTMGNTIVDLSTDYFGNMDVMEFKDCASTLGHIKGFSEAHWKTLADKAKGAWNSDVAKWTDEEIRSAAGIVTGLSPAELEKLVLVSLDAISAIGNNGKWTNTKAMSAFKSFKTHYAKNGLAVLKGTELRLMGHLACGANTGDIKEFTPEAYCTASADIGVLDTCETIQLAGYGSLAIHSKCYGEPGSWSKATMQDVGSVLGGLGSNALSTLSEDHIYSIKPWTISRIPHENINGFTKTQLEYMDVNQANSFTDEQISALDADKAAVIRGKATVVTGQDGNGKPGGGDSGCGLAEASFILVLTTVLAAILRI